MLQTIRDRLTGWVAGIIFFFIAVAFAFWGVDIGGANLNYAAKVNGEDIPIGDFRRQQQSQLSQYQQYYRDGIPAEIEERLRKGLLDSFIRQELVNQRTQKLGYRIGNESVASGIREMAAFKVGDEFSMDAYQARLAGQGMSAAGFEAQMRQSLRNSQLQSGLSQSSFVTPSELARYVALENQQRELSSLVMPATSFSDAAEVTEAEARAEYDANPDAYQSPETVDIEYVTLTRSDGLQNFEISDEKLREYYQQELAVGRFIGAEERWVRHILVSVGADKDDTAAGALAEELLTRIGNGEEFAALAKEYSDDPGSAQEGGDLGWSTPDAYVPAFREAIMGMQPGEIAGPVRTQFGYHVIKLEDARGESAKPFEEVRAELLSELQASEEENRFYERAEELRKLAFEAFNDLAPVAEAMELEIKTLAGITRNSGTDIASSAYVRDTAFSDPVMLDSENSELIELEDGGAVVLRVTRHTRSSLMPFATVGQQIMARMKREKAESMAAEAGRKIVEQARLSGNLDIEQKPEASTFTEKRYVGRNEAGVQRELLTAAFAVPAPTGSSPKVNGIRLANGDYAVYAVHTVRPGDLSTLNEEERQQRARQLAGQLGGLELAAYIAELRRTADVEINEEQLN